MGFICFVIVWCFDFAGCLVVVQISGFEFILGLGFLLHLLFALRCDFLLVSIR